MSGFEPLAAAAIAPEVGALLAPAAATAATAATTGAAAAGAGALGAGALGAAEAGAATGLLGAAPEAGALLGAAAPEAGAMAYVTPSILNPAAVAEGMAPGAYSDVAGEAFAAAHPAVPAWQTALGQAGKAGAAYGKVSGAMGGQQQGMPPPAPRPIFQGDAPQIAQAQPQHGGNQFAQMLLEQRRRGMLG